MLAAIPPMKPAVSDHISVYFYFIRWSGSNRKLLETKKHFSAVYSNKIYAKSHERNNQWFGLFFKTWEVTMWDVQTCPSFSCGADTAWCKRVWADGFINITNILTLVAARTWDSSIQLRYCCTKITQLPKWLMHVCLCGITYPACMNKGNTLLCRECTSCVKTLLSSQLPALPAGKPSAENLQTKLVPDSGEAWKGAASWYCTVSYPNGVSPSFNILLINVTIGIQ